jgi:2-pyrone-4,6-dicarboxylate lactonase
VTEPRPDRPQGAATNAPPRTTQYRPPRGACDSHCHIYGPFDRFPLPEDRSFTPHECPETALRALHDALGFDRAVIVHSQGHGLDHGPLLEALAIGRGRYRGVALLGPANTAGDVARLDRAGICGVRFNFLTHLGGNPSLEAMRAAMALARPFGWHVAIHVTGADLLRYADFIAGIEVRVVIDHMARPNLDHGLEACRQTLFRLLDSGRVWVKLSGADRLSRAGPPYLDVAPYASSLARHAPERVLWGSDWPHVNLSGPMSDDAALVELITVIAPTDDLRRRMLVDNPKEFFGFGDVGLAAGR